MMPRFRSGRSDGESGESRYNYGLGVVGTPHLRGKFVLVNHNKGYEWLFVEEVVAKDNILWASDADGGDWEIDLRQIEAIGKNE